MRSEHAANLYLSEAAESRSRTSSKPSTRKPSKAAEVDYFSLSLVLFAAGVLPAFGLFFINI